MSTKTTPATTAVKKAEEVDAENLILESSSTKITELMIYSSKLKLKMLENLCSVALENIRGQKDPVRRTEIYSSKAMLSAGLSLLDINFNLRFSRKWDPKEKKSMFNNIFSSTNVNPYDYESVISEDILNAPIMDICIIQRNEVVPEGYFRLSRTPSNKRADLNTGSTGHHLYLCIKKMASTGTPPITSLVVIYPDKKEYVPPGFSVVKRGGKPCNLNSGTSAERIFLCYKRDNACNPIIDLQIYFPTKNELLPTNFSKLSRSVRNYPVDLNLGTGAQPISFCFRYSIASLDCLIADPHHTSPRGVALTLKTKNITPSAISQSLPQSESVTLDLSEHWEYEKESRAAGSERSQPHSPSKVTRSVSFPEEGASSVDRDFSLDRPLSDSNMMEKFRAESQPVPEHTHEATEGEALNVTKLPRRGSTPLDEEVGETEGNQDDDDLKPEAIADVLAEEDDTTSVVPSLQEDEVDEVDLRTTRIVTIHDQPINRTHGHILRTILAALFTTGEMFETALDMLSVLLLEDTLFKSDYHGHPSNEIDLTMLDLTVHILCERLDCCVEVVNNSILQVLNRIILKSNGRLSKLCVQKIFRATTFVATAYSTRGHWVTAGYPEPVQDDGNEIFAYTVLKELIKYVTSLAEESDIDHSLPISQVYFRTDDLSQLTEDGREATQSYYSVDHLLAMGESYGVVCDIVIDFFDEVMDAVETSRVTEVALLAVAKKTSSTLSPSFWIQMNSLSLSLFRTYEVQNAFILLAALCKWSWLGIKTIDGGEAAPRHLGNKLLAIEALRDFCRIAGPKLRVSKIMGYQIRRIVVSSIFANMQYSTIEPRIFAKLLKLLSILWENWREQIRLEFPVLCQQILIKILQAPTVKMSPILHMISLKEMVKWFDQPHMLVEMFVNFDMDAVVAADWNIFAHITRAISLFAERSSRPVIPGSSPGPYPSEISHVGSAATMFGTNCVQIHPRDVKIKALEVISHITRAIMDATGHANLIFMDIVANDSNVMNRGWISKNIDEIIQGQQQNASNASQKRQSFTLKEKREATLQSAELLQQAVRIYQEKESVGKAVKFLISKNFMSDTPHEIAGFIRIYKDSFDPASIGDFLGEGGRNKQEEEYWNMIRYRFTRAVSFVDMELDDALRLYLTGCGFRMPGEAQKIDRFISAFVHSYWQDNRGTDFCPFHHEDTVHLLAYATIMLNTDLHRANIDKKKGGKKMTKVDFIKNLRGADQGSDINPELLSRIYDNIAATPIEMEMKAAVINESATGASKMAERDIAVTDLERQKKFFSDMLRNLRNTEDLMRSLSPYTHKFAIMGVDISISLELVSFLFESVWHYFHAIVDAILTKLNNEEQVIFFALDILCNSLTSCIFLNLKVEKLAFATQLARFRQICEVVEAEEAAAAAAASSSTAASLLNNLSLGGNKSSSSGGNKPSTSSSSAAGNHSSARVGGANFASGNFRKEKWFMSVEQSTLESAITAIAEVHSVVSQIKDMIKQFARREATKLAFSKIEKKANLKDGSRFFVMEGDLKKKNRAGKFVPYHFFLFSDLLVYAHQGFSEYKVHGQLELESTTVNSMVREDATNCCFIIENPLKSFVVMAESSIEKQTWVRSLKEVIAACCLRRRGQRLSILDRMQDQEKEVSQRQLMHESYSFRNSRPVSMREPLRSQREDENEESEDQQQRDLEQVEAPEVQQQSSVAKEDGPKLSQQDSVDSVEEAASVPPIPPAMSSDHPLDESRVVSDDEEEGGEDDDAAKDRLNDPMLALSETPMRSPKNPIHATNDADASSSPEKARSCHSPDHANLEKRKKIVARRSLPKVSFPCHPFLTFLTLVVS
jgi:hypothetical protein